MREIRTSGLTRERAPHWTLSTLPVVLLFAMRFARHALPLPQQCLYFFPLPQGQGLFRPIRGSTVPA